MGVMDLILKGHGDSRYQLIPTTLLKNLGGVFSGAQQVVLGPSRSTGFLFGRMLQAAGAPAAGGHETAAELLRAL